MNSESRLPGWLRHVLPLCTLGLMAGILLGERAGGLLLFALGAGLGLLSTALLRGRLRLAGLFALSVCVGGMAGFTAWHPALPAEGTRVVSGVVAQAFQPGKRGQQRTVLRDVTLDGEPLTGGAYWTFYTDLPAGLEPGAAVRFTGSVYHPAGAQNPGGYDFRASLLQNRIRVGVYGITDLELLPGQPSLYGMAAVLRERLTARLMAAMGPESGAWASALLLGSRYLLAEEDTDAFSTLGIGHLLSISGFHVAVLAGLLHLLMRLTRLPHWLRLCVLTVLLAGYALLTGLNPPIVRASLLAVLMEYGTLRQRQKSGLHLLCLSACATLLYNPTLLTGASFQLTYCAVAALVLVSPLISQSLSRLQPRGRLGALCGKWLLQPLSAALAVQLGVLLPQLYWFQQLPLLGLPINVLALTAAGLVLTVCWAAMAVMYVPWLGNMAGQAVGILLGRLTGAVRQLAEMNLLTLWTRQANWLTALGWVATCLCLCAYVSLPIRRRVAGLVCGMALIAASLIPLPHHGAEYWQLAVGSADAAVLLDEDQTVVIDTGEDGQVLASFLHQRRLSVDALVISHLHTDHAGGIEALLRMNIPVAVCYLPTGAEEVAIDPGMTDLIDALAARGTRIRHLSRGDSFSLPSGIAEALWPVQGTVRPGIDANCYSLALRIRLRGVTLLTAGDLDGIYERYAAVPADILKVSHHGSKASTGTDFLREVQPQLLIVPSGDAERLSSIRQRAPDSPVLGTQDGGAIHVVFGDGTFTAQPFLTGR